MAEARSRPSVTPKNSEGDFITLTEFCEVVGPEICWTGGIPPAEFDKNSFALKCIGVDYRKRRPQGCIPQPNSFDMQSIWTDKDLHVFSHNFAVPDFFGRGYTRTTSFAYVSRIPQKLTRILKTLRKVFSKAALELKLEGQKVFLSKINDCLEWVEHEISKAKISMVEVKNNVPAVDEGLRDDLEMYKDYFQLDLTEETLKHIKGDMTEIREQFMKPICELRRASCYEQQKKMREKGHRPHYRPQCRKKEFYSLMDVLSKLSIEKMKSRMEHILEHFQGSALEIAIERETRKVVSKEMVFNIGSMCQIPISISKTRKPREKYSQYYNTIENLSVGESRLKKNSFQPSSSESKWWGNRRSIAETEYLDLHFASVHCIGGHMRNDECPHVKNQLDWIKVKLDDNLADEPSVKVILAQSDQNPTSKSPAPDILGGEWHSSNSSYQEKKSSAYTWTNELISITEDRKKTSFTEDKKPLSFTSAPEILAKQSSQDLKVSNASTVNENQVNVEAYESSSSSSTPSPEPITSEVCCKTSSIETDDLLYKFLLGYCRGFAEEILNTIFIGRPLLLVGIDENCEIVKRYAKVLSMLVPGADQHSVELWRTEPLTVQQLTNLKIVGISTTAFLLTSPSVHEWCSYLSYEERTFKAPPYRLKDSSQWLSEILDAPSCKSPGQFRRYLRSYISRMQLRAYLYFWISVIGVVKAPASDASQDNKSIRQKQSMPNEDRARATLGFSNNRDLAIVAYWARAIERRVYKTICTHVPSRPLLKEDKPCSEVCIMMRDRLLQQHSNTPTTLHIGTVTHTDEVVRKAVYGRRPSV